MESIFQNVYDPSVMSGYGSSCTKASVSLAKRNSTNEQFFALLSQANSGFEWMFFIANDSVMKQLVKQAAKSSLYTDSYLKLYGPGTEFLPLENAAKYGGGFHE